MNRKQRNEMMKKLGGQSGRMMSQIHKEDLRDKQMQGKVFKVDRMKKLLVSDKSLGQWN